MSGNTVQLTRTTLAAKGVTSQVYQAVLAASPGGIAGSALRDTPAFLGLHPVAVENALYRLKSLGHIVLDRKAHLYRVDDTCTPPTMRKLRPSRAALLAEVADCASGVSITLLAEHFSMSPTEVLQAMARDLRRGTVRRFTMPAAHGGGIGLAINADMQVPDAPAAGPCAFELLPSHQFSMAWGAGFKVVLPCDVTRELFRFLDRLGGINTEASLDQAPAAAPTAPVVAS